MKDVKEELKKFIIEEIADDSEEIEYTSPLMSSGIIDSISSLQLVSFIEDNFNIEFLPHEVTQENLENINTIVEFIESKK
jgi:acyl carrier protein